VIGDGPEPALHCPGARGPDDQARPHHRLAQLPQQQGEDMAAVGAKRPASAPVTKYPSASIQRSTESSENSAATRSSELFTTVVVLVWWFGFWSACGRVRCSWRL
jgi:hypothetical protein